MTLSQAILIAVLQGATELFPVSSLGHAVLLPALAGWSLDEHAPSFLPFLVMLHLGTATALVAYFWREWWALGTGVLGLAPAPARAPARRLFLLIVIATIPAVIAGAALEKPLRALFGSPVAAAAFLVANAVLLLAAERLRARALRGLTLGATRDRGLAALRPTDAVAVGLWQCLALLPGISRSGATIAGGLLHGATHETAARFSFLIATPIILGATALEVPKLAHAEMPRGTLSLALVAALVAGVTALLCTALLMRWFRDHERWALDPFAWYCAALGLIGLAVLAA